MPFFWVLVIPKKDEYTLQFDPFYKTMKNEQKKKMGKWNSNIT